MTTTDDTRFKVLDCLISRVDIQRASRLLLDRISVRQGGYVCFSNIHTVVMARKDLRLREITNNSFLSMSDGKPLSIVAKWRGLTDVDRVAGPDFMPYFIHVAKKIRHFFFGSTTEILKNLAVNIREQFPEAVIAGYYSPPFEAISDSEMKEIIAIINQAKPDISPGMDAKDERRVALLAISRNRDAVEV